MKISLLYKKIIAATLILAFIVPATLGYKPADVAHADISTCAVKILAAIGIVTTAQGIAAPITVPVSIPGYTAAAPIVAADSTSQTIVECIEHEVALAAGKYLLSMMTSELVNWINSGFRGAPLFATDPVGFFEDVAEGVANTLLNQLGLCKDFGLNIQMMLSLNMPNTGDNFKPAKCKMSFSLNLSFGINFAKSPASWNNLLTATQVIPNNPMGAYLQGQDDIQTQVSKTKAIETLKLNWGSGFFSQGKNCTGSVCTVNTPGHTIAAQLDASLGVPFTQMGAADDLDKIFNALEGQLFKTIFASAVGLLGSNSATYHAGVSTSSNGPLADLVADAKKGSDTAAAGATTQSNQLSTAAAGASSSTGGPQSSAQNIAIGNGALPTASHATSGHPATALTDGDENHESDTGYTGSISAPGAGCNATTGTANCASVEVTLGTPTVLGEIRIYQRSSVPSVSDNGVQFHVVVLDKNGAVVWTGPEVTQDFSTNPFRYQVGDSSLPPKISGAVVKVQADTPGLLEISQIEVYPAVPPTITLNGGAAINLQINQPYNESNYGFTATDAFGNDLTSKVMEKPSTINTSTAGSYTISYSVTDMNGLTATAQREVVVAPPYTTPVGQ